MRGVIGNYDGTRLTSLAKTGDGVWWVTGTNTFTGSTSITAGTLVVSQLTGTGVAGPLGAATSAIQLGSTTVPASLRYTGTGHSTNRGITLTGTGTLEAAGPGAMTVTGTVTGVAGSAVTLLLTGTSMAANAMGMITEAADPAVTSVTKDGPGLWRLTSAASDFSGPFTVKNGTVVAAASAGASGVAGAFGSGGAPIVGDTAAGATGTAALLAEAGVTIRGVKVAAAGAGSTQAVLIGGASTTGTAIFASNPSFALGRSVALVAATGGAASFANGWLDAAESGIPSVDVAIGAPGYLGTVRLLSSGTLATTGSVSVRYGTALLGATTILDGAGTVAIDSGATLTGIGTVAAPLGGAGLVAPGNSPGILTAEGFDPALGLAAAFEFTGTAPDYTSASASVNDVLRLTGTTPFTAGLTASNVVSIYLSGSGNLGDVFEGGFFTDSTSAAFTNFQTLVASGSFVGYYQSGTGAYSYNGQNYALLSDLNRQLQVGVTTVPSAGFVSGSSTVINGQVTTFTVVVPEPATLVLAAMGIGLAARSLRRRRLAAATKMVPIAKIR
jgi:fibronectin-binding autotransporter adhesin